MHRIRCYSWVLSRHFMHCLELSGPLVRGSMSVSVVVTMTMMATMRMTMSEHLNLASFLGYVVIVVRVVVDEARTLHTANCLQYSWTSTCCHFDSNCCRSLAIIVTTTPNGRLLCQTSTCSGIFVGLINRYIFQSLSSARPGNTTVIDSFVMVFYKCKIQ